MAVRAMRRWWAVAVAVAAVTLAAKHSMEADQEFIDLFDSVLDTYETKTLHFHTREDFGIHHLPVEGNSNRFYTLLHNQTMVSTTQHAPSLDYGAVCLSQESRMSTEMFGNDHWSPELKNRPILVVTPCLQSDSLGNFLSCYFENIMCAQIVGVDYMAIGQVFDLDHFVPYTFYDQLPVLMKHHNPSKAPLAEIKAKLKATCRCEGSCHERPYALWPKGIPLVRQVVSSALRGYLSRAHPAEHNFTTVLEGDLNSDPNQTSLPLVPDAAIHYRCSDNFVGHYGFLPFRAFRDLIPQDAKTIFVLAERRDRKNVHKRYLPAKCDAVFARMFEYLKQHFPQAHVLIHRGGDMYLDMARLAFAKTTVCSISTFCLWAAIAAGRTAHVPKTALIVGGDTSLDLGFSWIESPPALLAKQFEFADASRIAQVLAS